MAAIPVLARRAIKTVYFILLTIGVGRTIGEPYKYINHDFVIKVGHLIYGAGDIGAENIDDTYFYIDVVAVLLIATVLYLITMKLIKLIRSK